MKALRGDRNQCPGCKEYFNSTGAFEKHRTGKFGVDRRCMTVEEMIAAGMSKKDDGFWITSHKPTIQYRKDDEHNQTDASRQDSV